MRAAVAATLLLAAGCTEQTLQGGNYTFVALPDAGIDDPCHLLDGGLGTGTLQVAAETAYLTYSIGAVQMQGQFGTPEYQEPDVLELDGTNTTAVPVLYGIDGGAHPCPSSYYQADMSGTVLGPKIFTGKLTLTYTMSSSNTDIADCVDGVPSTCELAAQYLATSTP